MKFVTGLRCAKDFRGESSTKRTRQPLCLNRNHFRQVRTSLYGTQWSSQGPLKHSTANHRWGCTAGHKTNMVQGSISAQTFSQCIKFVHKMRKSTNEPSCSKCHKLYKVYKSNTTKFIIEHKFIIYYWAQILESNSEPSTFEQHLFHRAHEERNTTNYPSHVPSGLQEQKSPVGQRSHCESLTSPSEHTRRQTSFQYPASSTQIEPLRWHTSLNGIHIPLQAHYIVFLLCAYILARQM